MPEHERLEDNFRENAQQILWLREFLQITEQTPREKRDSLFEQFNHHFFDEMMRWAVRELDRGRIHRGSTATDCVNSICFSIAKGLDRGTLNSLLKVDPQDDIFKIEAMLRSYLRRCVKNKALDMVGRKKPKPDADRISPAGELNRPAPKNHSPSGRPVEVRSDDPFQFIAGTTLPPLEALIRDESQKTILEEVWNSAGEHERFLIQEFIIEGRTWTEIAQHLLGSTATHEQIQRESSRIRQSWSRFIKRITGTHRSLLVSLFASRMNDKGRSFDESDDRRHN